MYDYYLYHHGIKGQKWGVRRFQNKDGSLTSAGKKHAAEKADSKEKTGLSDKQKKAVKIGAAAAGTALAAYGAYKYAQANPDKIDADSRRPEDMSTQELQQANARAKALKIYKNNNSSNRLETANNAVNITSNTINKLRQSNREAMAEERNSYKKPRMDLSKMSDQELRQRINREQLERQYNQLFNASEPTVSRGRTNVDRILGVAGDVAAVTGSALAIAVSIQQLKELKGGK